MPESLLRLEAVKQQTGLSHSSLYRLIQAGQFPAPIKIAGSRSVGWIQSTVTNWVAEQIANHQNQQEQ